MKTKLSVFVLLAIMSLFTATSSYASFPVKKQPVSAAAPAAASSATPAPATASEEPAVTTEKATTATAKKSWFGRMFTKAKEAAIPEILYIIMAIFPLGWLAMGINDNFTGSRWLISLLLYILFYLPGLVYTLIMIPKYY